MLHETSSDLAEGNWRRSHRRTKDAKDDSQVHGQVVQHHIHVWDGDEVDSLRLQEVFHGRLVLARLHHCCGRPITMSVHGRGRGVNLYRQKWMSGVKCNRSNEEGESWREVLVFSSCYNDSLQFTEMLSFNSYKWLRHVQFVKVGPPEWETFCIQIISCKLTIVTEQSTTTIFYPLRFISSKKHCSTAVFTRATLC